MAIEVYRSIRYASASRFGHPRMAGTVEHAPAAVCPQRESRLGGIMGPMLTGNPLSEDCLRLSVFTPSSRGSRPVMVWICGGAFITGSGEFARYDASRLCEEGDIVVVNVSYRVGAFGFLYQPERGSVNLGLEDQICALEWVRENIAAFGGDPGNVTVCGQSAGAYSIANIIARGRTDLFGKAILFSAPLGLKAGKAAGNRVRKAFLRALAACSRNADIDSAGIDTMLEAQAAMLGKTLNPLPFCPVGESIYPDDISSLKGLGRVLLTCQANDAQPFSPLPLLTSSVTRAIFSRPMERYADFLRKAGVEVRTRTFRWHPDNNGIGACHTLEIPFLFGSWECWNRASMLAGAEEEEFERLGLELRSQIADFVRLSP